MSVDPIRAALDAAAQAMRDRIPAPLVITRPTFDEYWRTNARITIVTFLRALPEDSLRLPSDAGLLLGYLPRALADAVEKAVLADPALLIADTPEA